MKRWSLWLLILVLALAGCTAQKPNTTTGATEPVNTTQRPTVPPVSLTINGSTIEKSTDGAVRVFAAQGGEIVGIDAMGDDIVVYAYDGKNTTITRMTSDAGLVKAEFCCSGLVTNHNGTAGAFDNHLAYYDAQKNNWMILDGAFHGIDIVDMPAEISGTPVLTADLSAAYYTDGAEIRAVDMHTGIPRLVCQLNVQQLEIVDLLFDDAVLYCRVTDMDGNSYHAFYSTENGKHLGKDASLLSIQSWQENYLVCRMDATVTELLVGGKERQLQSLTVSDIRNDLCLLPGIGGVAEISSAQNVTQIAVYELERGKTLGQVTLIGSVSAGLPMEDPNGNYIWFRATNPDNGEDVLCRWDYAAAGGDDTMRVGVRYTAQNPDTEGLAQCQKLADEISKKYYVDILLGADVVEPWNYSFVQEYQVSAYMQALEALDTAMARFPEDFFRIVGISSKNPKLQISLIRQLVPNRYDIPKEDDGLQYWIDECAYIALVVGDKVEQNFYHELCHAMSTYVNSHSSQFDYWGSCNPADFQYDHSYDRYETHADSPYLSGENRAFIDTFSMTYPHEDRATVMEYAMMDGCEELFASEYMQQKLTVLAKGIRRAFGWRYYEGTFPWEQYLVESQAYVKKK